MSKEETEKKVRSQRKERAHLVARVLLVLDLGVRLAALLLKQAFAGRLLRLVGDGVRGLRVEPRRGHLFLEARGKLLPLPVVLLHLILRIYH